MGMWRNRSTIASAARPIGTLIRKTQRHPAIQRIWSAPANRPPTSGPIRLEMPKTALAWSHQLMRLMLKYREIGGLGDAAADVLAFARNLRALDALLHDPARAAAVIVTLDQAVVAAETNRLAEEMASRGIAVSAVVLNRAARTATFPLPRAPLHLEAPLEIPPPAGPEQLIHWSQTWVPQTS